MDIQINKLFNLNIWVILLIIIFFFNIMNIIRYIAILLFCIIIIIYSINYISSFSPKLKQIMTDLLNNITKYDFVKKIFDCPKNIININTYNNKIENKNKNDTNNRQLIPDKITYNRTLDNM